MQVAARTLATLDPDAIARVVDEARPEWRDADELHDALLTTGFLIADEGTVPSEAFATLSQAGRAASVVVSAFRRTLLVAAERLPELLAIHPDAVLEPPISAPPRAARTCAEAMVELLRGRLAVSGPVTAAACFIARSPGRRRGRGCWRSKGKV